MSQRLKSLGELDDLRRALQAGRDPERVSVAVCAGTGCHAYGSKNLLEVFRQEIGRRDLGARVELRATGCHGFCERGPLVVIRPAGLFYQQVQPADVPEIVERTVLQGEVLERLLYRDQHGQAYLHEHEVPFYKHQQRVLLAHNGEMDPTRIEDYLAAGGYAALGRVLTGMRPEEVVEAITRSGLRGRGGGGFPAGVKWRSCREAPSADGVRYIICNADEGDPGAFMDRSLMEGNPHLVLEGMLIGAWAIGCPGKPVGYVYIRNEYPLAVERLELALRQARELGLLGRDILGSGLDFDISINRGGGAFVCGESTALMASIEGEVGEPRAKHIHTVVAGLHDKPTNLNNVETWANVPIIIQRGVEWFTSIGTGDVTQNPWGGSKGTKIFALVGKVNNTGLVEVPMGASLRHIIYDIGGGMRAGRSFKAVQTGGPSGGCLPESLLDLQVDFDRLTEVGSMMGSGGMIVMDDSTCMVDVARYFLHFLSEESCGKCLTCRSGLTQLCLIIDRIADGQAREGDLDLLERLSQTVAAASLCGLGQTAPNPLLSTLRFFRQEYEEHVREHRCRARVCKALLHFSVLPDKCNGCSLCRKKCPSGAIQGEPKKAHVIDPERCTRCGVCLEVCRQDAVLVR